MFDHRHYVPILKWKRGEYRALQNLDQKIRQRLTPLCEVPPIAYDPSDEGGADPAFDDRVTRLASQVEGAWIKTDRLFLDLGLLQSDARIHGKEHPVTFIFNDARARGLKLVPVTGLNRDSEHQAAVAGVTAADGRGICLRIHFDDFNDEDFADAVDNLVSEIGISYAICDIVIDLRSIIGVQPSLLTPSIVSLIAGLPHVTEWRSLTVASGAFPENLTHMALGPNVVPRLDWALWQSITTAKPTLPRIPTFGDYGVVHPILPELDMSTINVSASARYTTDVHWLVMRGRGLRTRGSGGHGQYIAHATALLNRPEFCGADFSAGDGEIAGIAAGTTTGGNPETWLRIATNHHLTFVVTQLASLGDSGAAGE